MQFFILLKNMLNYTVKITTNGKININVIFKKKRIHCKQPLINLLILIL